MRSEAPRATQAIAIATVIAFAAAAITRRQDVMPLVAGFVPARLAGLAVPGALPAWLTPLSATLVHAGLLHLLFNMLMLLYCGREDEVALGRSGIAILYVVGAYAAAAGQYAFGPDSISPMVGASGAISALVGAYALLYGQRRSSRLPPEAARWLHILWLAAAWLAIQFLLGLAWGTRGIAVATGAHVGGFIAGLLLARPLLRWRYRSA